MMNLRNMVQGLESDAVALGLIAQWEHDKGTIKFWRASSTFVYAFKRKRKTYFLRFVFEQETPLEHMNRRAQGDEAGGRRSCSRRASCTGILTRMKRWPSLPE